MTRFLLYNSFAFSDLLTNITYYSNKKRFLKLKKNFFNAHRKKFWEDAIKIQWLPVDAGIMGSFFFPLMHLV